MQGDYFVAWRRRRPVGNIAAFINHRHNEFHHEHIGFFGLSSCMTTRRQPARAQYGGGLRRKLGYDAIPARRASDNDECGV